MTVIVPGAEQPVTAAFLVLYCIIIPVLPFIQPPFPLDAFRAVSFFDDVSFTFIRNTLGG